MDTPGVLLARRPWQRGRGSRGGRPRRECRQQRSSWHRRRQAHIPAAKLGGLTAATGRGWRRVCAMGCSAPAALAVTSAARRSRRTVWLLPIAAVHASQALAPGDAAALGIRLRLPGRWEPRLIRCPLPARRLISAATPSRCSILISLSHAAPVTGRRVSRVRPHAAAASHKAQRWRRGGPACWRGRAQHPVSVAPERRAPLERRAHQRVVRTPLLPAATWQVSRRAVLLRRAQLPSLTAVVAAALHVRRRRPPDMTPRRQGPVWRRRRRRGPPTLAGVHRRRGRRAR